MKESDLLVVPDNCSLMIQTVEED